MIEKKSSLYVLFLAVYNKTSVIVVVEEYCL